MADTVAGAMLALWNATTAVTAAVTGRLWLDEIPEDYTLPFARLEILDGEDELSAGLNMPGPYIETVAVRITVYAKTAAAAEALVAPEGAVVKTAFDGATLVYTSTGPTHGRHMACIRLKAPTVNSEAIRFADGEAVYSASLEYRVMVDRGR